MKKEWQDHLTHWGKWSTGTEVKRGLLHFLVGLSAWLVLHPLFYGNQVVWAALIIVASVFSAVEVVRKTAQRSSAVWADRVTAFVSHFTRDNEKSGDLTTTLQTILGCTVAWVFCPRWICALAGLLLGVVDPISKLGKRFPMGPRFKNGKSRGGMLFGLGVGIIAAIWVGVYHFATPLFPVELGFWHVVTVYTVGVCSAPVFEVLGGKWDNFYIPAGTAILMSIVDIVLSF